jgi:hypothetical protein
MSSAIPLIKERPPVDAKSLAQENENVLTVRKLSKSFGGQVVLNKYRFESKPGGSRSPDGRKRLRKDHPSEHSDRQS